MTEVCCKDSNELKHGKSLALSKHLGAGGYNDHRYSMRWSGLGRAGIDTSAGVFIGYLTEDAD